MRPRMRQRWERMSDEERNLVIQDINWQCTLPPAQTTAAETHLLPLASFTPSLYGQRLQGLTLDASTIKHVGLNVGVFDTQGKPDPHCAGGPFRLELQRLAFVG